MATRRPSREGLPPTEAQREVARAFLVRLAGEAGYPMAPATGKPADGWRAPVAARLGVSVSYLGRVWGGVAKMPRGWR